MQMLPQYLYACVHAWNSQTASKLCLVIAVDSYECRLPDVPLRHSSNCASTRLTQAYTLGPGSVLIQQ